MTVSSVTPSVTYVYTGPNLYDFNFLTYKESDLVVSHFNTSGVETVLVLNVNYTVVLDQYGNGGYISVTSPAPASGTLVIRRVLPITQEVDWVNNSPLDADILERSFDRLVMILQQMDVILSDELVATTWRGNWITSVIYSSRDVIIGPDTNLYICAVAHTSGTFATDLASGYWVLVVDVASATAAAAAALVSEANAKTSEENAANCAGAAYNSAVSASNDSAAAAASAVTAENAKVVALQAALDAQSPERSQYTLGTTGSIALDPDNGVHQICDASATVTFTDSFEASQYMILQVRRNSQTINWPSITWMKGSAPTLDASDWERLELWKVGATLYGIQY